MDGLCNRLAGKFNNGRSNLSYHLSDLQAYLGDIKLRPAYELQRLHDGGFLVRQVEQAVQ